MTLLELAQITKVAALGDTELQEYLTHKTPDETKRLFALLEELEDMMIDARYNTEHHIAPNLSKLNH